MQHPINGKVRLAGPVKRLYCKFFKPSNPLGWADYHMVAERSGGWWVHCHGLKRRIGFDLEITGVPKDLRKEALRMLTGIIRTLRKQGKIAPDRDFGGHFSGSRQSFSQAATFRKSSRTDDDHKEIIRIVDMGQPLHSGFPVRLFAAHLVARGQSQTDAKKAEKLFRRAIDLSPGEVSTSADGADYDPAAGDITGLQLKSNLGGYLGLALALRAQNRAPDACAAATEAIARCPGWAQLYRDYFIQTDDRKDTYQEFWRSLDILSIASRHQPELKAPGPAAGGGGNGGGFGARTRPVRRI
jgi:hypothetical protein